MNGITGRHFRKPRVSCSRVRSLSSAEVQRNGGANYSSFREVGINRKLAMDQFNPFVHAGKTEAVSRHCLFAIKTDSGVTHSQLDLVRCPLEPHFEML